MSNKPTKISFITNVEKGRKLRKVAETLDICIGEVINEALDRYIDVYEWQVRHIQEGVNAAERGEFASDYEVEAFFKQLMTLNEDNINSLDSRNSIDIIII